jgi:uncharacterized protein (TIGR02452 family)
MRIAQDTVRYIQDGGYNGHKFSNDIDKAILYRPEQFDNLTVDVDFNKPQANITVYNEDTCECAKRFIDDGYTCILNFASARHVGGGFLNGAMAQEEAICRNSTLYASINSDTAKEYYTYNNANVATQPLYSDYTIFSPCVDVFRDAYGYLIDDPYTISAITSPAVNVHSARGCSQLEISKCMVHRAEYIIKIAIENHVDNLVLGAWGCGVFGNDPKDVSNWFKRLLFENGYIHCFKNVSFGVYDRQGSNYETFLDTFSIR